MTCRLKTSGKLAVLMITKPLSGERSQTTTFWWKFSWKKWVEFRFPKKQTSKGTSALDTWPFQFLICLLSQWNHQFGKLMQNGTLKWKMYGGSAIMWDPSSSKYKDMTLESTKSVCCFLSSWWWSSREAKQSKSTAGAPIYPLES